MSERIIPADRSVIVAADVESVFFAGLVDKVSDVEGIGGIKVGFQVGLGMGLDKAVRIVRSKTETQKVIYDHQKGATDIPDTGKNFASVMERAGVNAAILFPFTGPDVEDRWIRELQERGIGVIVGAEMTHPNISGKEGFIKSTAFKKMFAKAIDMGVKDFVVPGNKPNKVASYRGYFEHELGGGNFTLYAPGFVAQGGEISEAGKAAGDNWHAIVGRGITEADDSRQAAIAHTKQILGET